MKQVDKSIFEGISRLEPAEVMNECGGFKFKTNTIPTFCPICREAALIAISAVEYICAHCGNVARTSFDEK